jgi:thioredoxin 1
MSELIHFSTAGFDAALNSSDLLVVDFWATWCGPCRMIAPTIEELAAEAPEGVVVGKVDVDQESELAARYGVMSIPTVLVIKNGQEVARLVGARPKADYEAAIEANRS